MISLVKLQWKYIPERDIELQKRRTNYQQMLSRQWDFKWPFSCFSFHSKLPGQIFVLNANIISYTLVIWHWPLTIEQIAPWWLKMLGLVLEPLESFFVSLLPLLSPLSPLHPPLILPLSSLSLSPPSSQSHFLSIGKVASWWYADYSEKGSRQEKKRGNDLI